MARASMLNGKIGFESHPSISRSITRLKERDMGKPYLSLFLILTNAYWSIDHTEMLMLTIDEIIAKLTDAKNNNKLGGDAVVHVCLPEVPYVPVEDGKLELSDDGALFLMMLPDEAAKISHPLGAMIMNLDVHQWSCRVVTDGVKLVAVVIEFANGQMTVKLDSRAIQEIVRVWVNAGGELDLRG